MVMKVCRCNPELNPFDGPGWCVLSTYADSTEATPTPRNRSGPESRTNHDQPQESAPDLRWSRPPRR